MVCWRRRPIGDIAGHPPLCRGCAPPVDEPQFAELYTLAQVAPGPNAMYVTLIGWHLAGWAGAAATTIPLLVPATTLTLLVGHFNERYPNAPIVTPFVAA